MRLVSTDQPMGIRFPAGVSLGSGPARRLQEVLRDVNFHLMTAAAAYGTDDLCREIDRAFLEASTENWDSDGALAVADETAEFAKEFARLLPPGLPTPEVDAGARGELMLTWRGGHRRAVIVSLYPNRSVGHSVIRGLARSHGREPFCGVVPDEVWGHLKTVLGL